MIENFLVYKIICNGCDKELLKKDKLVISDNIQELREKALKEGWIEYPNESENFYCPYCAKFEKINNKIEE